MMWFNEHVDGLKSLGGEVMTTALLVILVFLTAAAFCVGLGIWMDIKEREKAPECFDPVCKNHDGNCGDCPWSNL